MASQQSPYLSEARWAYLANMGSRGRTHKSEVGMNIWNRGPTLTLCRLSEHDVRSWCASSVLDPLLETAWPQNLKSNSKHCKMCFSMCIIWISGYLQLPQQSIDCCVHIYPFMFTCNKDLKKGWLWASAESPTSFTQYVCSQCASSYEDRWPTLSWHRQRNLKFSSRPASCVGDPAQGADWVPRISAKSLDILCFPLPPNLAKSHHPCEKNWPAIIYNPEREKLNKKGRIDIL